MTIFTNTLKRTSALTSALLLMTGTAMADQVFADDLIVQGSACIGIDCSNGESFGFDTIRLKENNLRIKAQDTSTSASFPTVDWQITFNDSSNGGANKFSVDDIDNNRTPFTIEAGSINNALYVSDAGDIGVGTATPIVEVHAVDGNSPTFRLEQDGSSGFTPQTWDLAGNETNFFLRDVTNGSKLPLRVQPNTPDQTMFMRTTGMTINETGANYDLRVESDTLTDALFMDGGTGNIGMGTDVPSSKLHIVDDTETTLKLTLEKNAGTTAGTWEYVVRNDGNFAINNPDSAGADFIFRRSDDGTPGLTLLGDVRASGSFIANGSTLNVPDYVFAPEYELMPLSEVQSFIEANSHLPEVPSAADVKSGGLDITQMQLTLLKKVEELTLYTLAQEEKIALLETRLSAAE